MRAFEVHPTVTPEWPGMTAPARVVAEFLAHVRTTADPEAARRVLASPVRCHQVVSDLPETIERTPEEYAAHVHDMLEEFGRFRFRVTELLTEADHVYVRWRQDGRVSTGGGGQAPTTRPVVEVGSAVYRVVGDKIVEYWVQLDRLGLQTQLETQLES